MIMSVLYRLAAVVAVILMFPCVSGAQYRSGGGYSDLYDSETVTAFKKHIGFLASASLEGRKAGSEGEKAAAEYVYSCLKEYGVDMLCPESGDEFGISKDGADTLTSRNVLGFIQGYDKDLRNRYIVIGARLDNLGTNIMTWTGMFPNRYIMGQTGMLPGWR